MGEFWELLKLSSSASSLPPILVKHEVASSGYSIHLSDLTHMWTECMNAKDIRKRALNADTSIDPSEDFEQMRLFLRRINDALEQKPGTSVDLAYDERVERLLLKTYTPLPGSLRPLQWIVELAIESPSALTIEMILPLLRQLSVQNAESVSLVQQLKEKDHIIDKLIDAMQTDGVPLSRMFPGAPLLKTAMQSNPRQALSKNVKGFSKFNEQQWQKDLGNSLAQPSRLDELVSSVFQQREFPTQEMMPFPYHGEWWLRMSEESPHETRGYSEPHSETEESEDKTEHVTFQRRRRHITSPRLSQQTPRDDSTTDDEDGLAAATAFQRTKLDPESHTSTREASDEGLISRPKENASRSAELAVAPTSPDGKRKSPTERIANSKFTQDPKAWKKKAKIGRIGGKTKADPLDVLEPLQSANASAEPATLGHQQERRRLNIADSPGMVTSPEAEPERGTRAQTKRDSGSPAPEETENQRADRNRIQIKHALEAKTAAPAKKKQRRF